MCLIREDTYCFISQPRQRSSHYPYILFLIILFNYFQKFPLNYFISSLRKSRICFSTTPYHKLIYFYNILCYHKKVLIFAFQSNKKVLTMSNFQLLRCQQSLHLNFCEAEGSHQVHWCSPRILPLKHYQKLPTFSVNFASHHLFNFLAFPTWQVI